MLKHSGISIPECTVYLMLSKTLEEWDTFCPLNTYTCSYGYPSSLNGTVCS